MMFLRVLSHSLVRWFEGCSQVCSQSFASTQRRGWGEAVHGLSALLFAVSFLKGVLIGVLIAEPVRVAEGGSQWGVQTFVHRSQ